MEPPAASERTKLFVGGISSGTRESALREYFARFGEVADAEVVMDRFTGNPRGFGFVRFADPEVAEAVLEKADHAICGKNVEVKRAMPRGNRNQNRHYQSPQHIRWWGSSNNGGFINGNNNSKKIFIGGLPDSVTQLELKNYFEKYGSVVDAVVMYDSATQRSRGFGFIAFSSEESVTMALQQKDHVLNGKMVDVKVAVPRGDNNFTKNRNNGNCTNSRTADGRGSSYDSYQGAYSYPSYGSYGYRGCYDYYNYCGATPPHYIYSSFYGGYNMNGWNGIGYGGTYGNTIGQQAVQVIVLNSDLQNGSLTNSISVSADRCEEGDN